MKAVNIREKIPNAETIAAIEEGRRMARDLNAKRYANVAELRKALEL